MPPSCALDVVDRNPAGLSSTELGEILDMDRTAIWLIIDAAAAKARALGLDLEAFSGANR
jgi:hypothetical protein